MVQLIQYCSEVAATKIAPTPNMAICSITDPGESADLQPGWGALFRIAFGDASYTEDTIQFYGRMWPLSSLGFPTKEHALQILHFLGTLPPQIDTLIIHCGAGISRSGAVAKYSAEYFHLQPLDTAGRHNATLYRLLHHPDVFDAILAECTRPAPPFWRRALSFLST
jgi:predicted protein tyrosine phosphatase